MGSEPSRRLFLSSVVGVLGTSWVGARGQDFPPPDAIPTVRTPERTRVLAISRLLRHPTTPAQTSKAARATRGAKSVEAIAGRTGSIGSLDRCSIILTARSLKYSPSRGP